MTREIFLDDDAEVDLQKISDWTVRKFSENQAREYIAGIYQKAELYATQTEIGQDEPQISERLSEAVQSFLYVKHRIFYVLA